MPPTSHPYSPRGMLRRVQDKVFRTAYHHYRFYLHLLAIYPLFWRPKNRWIARTQKYIHGALRERLLRNNGRYLLIEHPKCGRTWLRYMIHQAEAKSYDIPLRNMMYEIWYPKYCLPRVDYGHRFSIGAPDPYSGFILLVRRPIIIWCIGIDALRDR